MMIRPDVRFQPSVQRGLLRGVELITDAIRPTLGPLPRVVAVAAASAELPAELLDDGALIARRIIQLNDDSADVGAMLLRQMLWQLHEEVGDGAATAALIFQALVADGVRYIAAGGDAVALRSHLEAGLAPIFGCLTSLARPLEDFTAAARKLCDDAAVADTLGEVFTTLGPYAAVDILEGHTRGIEREYIPGTFWKLSGLLAASSASSSNSELENALILATDFDLETPQDLEAPLRCALRLGRRSLVIVARSVSDKVKNFIAAARSSGQFQLLCVKTPGQDTSSQMQALQDLALLTGCRPLLRGAGQTFDSVREDDLGSARRVWATQDNFGIEQGAGDADALDAYIESLQQQINSAAGYAERATLYERMSHFLGMTAIVRVGGATVSEIKMRKAQASRALQTLRGAGIEGVVPGGGMALYAVSAALPPAAAENSAAQAARRMLVHALRQPFNAIVENSGIEAGSALAAVSAAGCLDGNFAYDVIDRRAVDVWQAGLVDSAPVVAAAVRAAVKTAALCLTIDVVVHHRQPEVAVNP